MSTPLSSERLADLEPFLIELNRVSAEVILPLFRTENGLENKAGGSDFDPVTQADKGAEAAIRKAIAARYPDHGVIGEEYGSDRPDAEFVWVLDPIDGTRAFISGLPVWTTLIGMRFQGEPVLGSIGQPYLEEVFLGSAAGSRVLRRGKSRPLKVRACPALAQATVATTDTALFKGEDHAAWTRVRAAARLARLGCDAYAYAMVAAGMIDLVLEAGLKSWDVEAAVPVLDGAGGVVADWTGARVGREGGKIAVAGDRACLDRAVALLKGADA
jgi:histidinol phosphatase-like enzyme (inositol monophosphatase family)